MVTTMGEPAKVTSIFQIGYWFTPYIVEYCTPATFVRGRKRSIAVQVYFIRMTKSCFMVGINYKQAWLQVAFMPGNDHDRFKPVKQSARSPCGFIY